MNLFYSYVTSKPQKIRMPPQCGGAFHSLLCLWIYRFQALPAKVCTKCKRVQIYFGLFTDYCHSLTGSLDPLHMVVRAGLHIGHDHFVMDT